MKNSVPFCYGQIGVRFSRAAVNLSYRAINMMAESLIAVIETVGTNQLNERYILSDTLGISVFFSNLAINLSATRTVSENATNVSNVQEVSEMSQYLMRWLISYIPICLVVVLVPLGRTRHRVRLLRWIGDETSLLWQGGSNINISSAFQLCNINHRVQLTIIQLHRNIQQQNQ